MQPDPKPVFVSGLSVHQGEQIASFLNSLRSLAPLCDEMVVCLSRLQADTLSAVRALGETKIRIVQDTGEATGCSKNDLDRRIRAALRESRGRWCIYLPGNEAVRPQSRAPLLSALEKYDDHPDVEGLLVPISDEISGRELGKEVRAFKNHIGVFPFGNGREFRCWGEKIRVAAFDAPFMRPIQAGDSPAQSKAERACKLIRPRAQREIPPAKKICLIRIRSIGDTLLTTSAFRELKKAIPDCRLTLVIEPKCLDMVRSNPYLDEIVLYQRGWKSLLTLWKLFRGRYDVTIDFLGNVRSAIATVFTGGKTRIGLDERWRKWTYTHRILGRYYGYVGWQNLEFLRPLGIRARDSAIEIYPNEEHKKGARNFFEREELPINETLALYPTASWITKHWGDDNYIALGQQLAQDKRRRILVFWGPAEQDRAARIANGIGPAARLIPESGFLEAAALFGLCCLGVGNDSAFAHLAIASGLPTITLFGPTRESCWNPPDNPRHISVSAALPCRPCDRQSCDSPDCMKAIAPAQVFDAVVSMLAKGVTHAR